MTIEPALLAQNSNQEGAASGELVNTIAAPTVLDGDVIALYATGIIYSDDASPISGQHEITQIESAPTSTKRVSASCQENFFFISTDSAFWGFTVQVVVIQDAGSHPANYVYTLATPASQGTELASAVHWSHWRGAGSPDYVLSRSGLCDTTFSPEFTDLTGDLFLRGYSKAFVTGGIGTPSGYTSLLSYSPLTSVNFSSRLVYRFNDGASVNFSPDGPARSKGTFGIRVYEDSSPLISDTSKPEEPAKGPTPSVCIEI